MSRKKYIIFVPANIKLNRYDHSLWVYIVTVNNPNLSGDKIVARFTDFSDNLAEKEAFL